MRQYRTPIVLGLSLVAVSVLAANNGTNTLPIAKHLKDNDSDAVSFFRSNPLITDQGNKASGEQSFELYVKPGSKFSIKAEGNVISPGTSATLKKQVNADGILSFSIAPAEANIEGKTNYEVRIAEIYSNADRFWSPHSPTYTSWTDTGSNVGPLFGRQNSNSKQRTSLRVETITMFMNDRDKIVKLTATSVR